jgi:purine-cytosine permease-like protein
MDSIPFNPPAPQAMSDADLQAALGSARADQEGIEAAMWLLDTQSALREEDKAAFSNWRAHLESIGTPEALAAIENVLRARQGLAPIEPAPIEERLEIVDQAPSVEEPFDLDAFDLLLAADRASAEQPMASIDDVYGAEEEFTALEEASQARLPETFAQPVPAVGVRRSSVAQPVAEMSPESKPAPILEPLSFDESASLGSTPKSARTGRASFQFWAWLALTGSVLPFGAAAYLNSLEISFVQSSISLVLAVFVSAAVIAIGALAGKRSGLPTLLLSRAAFGVLGNYFPATFLLIARVFTLLCIGAFALFTFSNSTAEPASLDSLLESAASPTGLIGLLTTVAILIAAVALAIFGGHVLFTAQKYVGALGVLVVLAIFFTNVSAISTEALRAQPEGSWLDAFSAAILIFSVFGLTWAGTGADFARKLPVNARGIKVVGWGFLSLAIVPSVSGVFALALFGSTDFSISSNFAVGLATQLGTILYWIVLASLAASLVVVLAMALYSTSLTAHSINIKIRPVILQPLLGLIVLVVAVLASLHLGSDGFWFNFAGYSLTLAVPIGAWAGVFVSDVLIRRIAYHEVSLTRSYGFYKPFNWINLSGWLIAVIVGFGLIQARPQEFFWQGYLVDLSANPGFWVASSFGVVIAFSIGLLLPVVAGIPRIKKQESEVLSIEARKNDLKDIFGYAE